MRMVVAGAGIAGGVALLVVAGVALGFMPFGKASRPDLIIHVAGKERLQMTITERGQLESADNKEITCRVKARSASSTVSTTIRWIIEDGTEVQKGDRLVQLDDSGLYEQLKTQKIALDKAYADYVAANSNYEVVESQNRSDIETAKITLSLARIDLEKYQKGEYIQSMQDIDGRLMIAKSDLAMWEERAAWSARMSRPGRQYVTAAQAQADEARLKSARIATSKVEEEKRVLSKYTGPRTETDFKGKIDEAVRAIDRVNAQARAKEVQGDADRKAKLSIYDQERGRYTDIEEEIKKCTIYAPQAGLVVYYISEQSRFGSGSQQSIIAQGEPVREGQKLMRIPDLSKMVVNTKVHEAMISRVRGEAWKRTGYSEGVQAGLSLAVGSMPRLMGLAYFNSFREDFIDANRDMEMVKVGNGQPAQVRVDAFQDRVLEGEVKNVATVASQQDWMSADVKVYQTMVSINQSVPGLKPGMSAEVTILTDSQRDNVLVVPVGAILGSIEMGDKRRVYIMGANGPEPRDVVVGLSNDKMAEIVSGIEEGEKVIVNSRVLLSDREKAKIGDTGTYRPSSGDKGEFKGKAKGKDGKGGKGPGGPKGPQGPPQG